MGWDEWLRLWCAVWGAAALVGVGRSLAGLTGAQRTVRLTGRIERVRPPRHGGSRRGGISVVVGYRDPASGQQVTVTNDGERGEPITEAWEGREIGVNHPRGRPHAYRFARLPDPPGRGLGWPAFALFLVYVGLVVLAAIDWAWPWALIGVGVPGALAGASQLPGAVRAKNARLRRLAGMETAPGEVVAVLKDVSVDQDDGGVSTTITPVLAFTTRDGRAVTAFCTEHLPGPAGARGRAVTVHYSPADPAEFTLDPAADHRSADRDVTIHAAVAGLLAATAVAGALLL
ncbi:DUF3592 domain-containing protein [Streptomyces sp. TLI_171]|uniref:DUF3592 domain-containing protein n=1 Tax=Streptomyces sp. TLI_171 TaxID=1938859 RepID=UPI000C19BD75|nr:DUF3592 domain-containing protein [Streptomyces sp. TLI_171]RKE17757.1 uncharacterized protein DUF3592 [Streptomyces sp. TLI_171]